MNAYGFRLLFDYHFTVNHKIWQTCIVPLSDAQYTTDEAYSHGSIRNQLVHMMSVDARWFASSPPKRREGSGRQAKRRYDSSRDCASKCFFRLPQTISHMLKMLGSAIA